MKAEAITYLNIHDPNKDEECPVSIKVTFYRKRRKYPIGISFLPEDFAEPKNKKQKKDLAFAESMKAKAITAIESLGDGFTFELFERVYLRNASLKDSLESAFDDYIDAMSADRVGNKSAYADAKNSFLKYRPNSKFADVTVKWLRDYENWMDERGRSKTTIGMYTRSLRSVFNEAVSDGKISKERYPFGEKKYDPPTGKNKKKALNISDIAKIFSAQLEPDSTAERMRDYWIFLYLCNGMNVADFCRLKHGNYIKGEAIRFIRQKTKRTKREVEEIHISLQEPAIKIINKYAQKAISKDEYLFPHLNNNMNYDEQRKATKNLTRLINDHVRKVAIDLGIKVPVKTMEARHSFATIVLHSGAPVAMISEALGHTSISTTQNYLDSFETDQVKKASAALLDFGPAKEENAG